MGDCDMTTIWSMLVLMFGVLNTTIDVALIPMVIMLMVQMPIVHVIEMIVMGNCGVSAIWTMNMWVLVFHLKIMPQDRSLRRKGIA